MCKLFGCRGWRLQDSSQDINEVKDSLHTRMCCCNHMSINPSSCCRMDFTMFSFAQRNHTLESLKYKWCRRQILGVCLCVVCVGDLKVNEAYFSSMIYMVELIKYPWKDNRKDQGIVPQRRLLIELSLFTIDKDWNGFLLFKWQFCLHSNPNQY